MKENRLVFQTITQRAQSVAAKAAEGLKKKKTQPAAIPAPAPAAIPAQAPAAFGQPAAPGHPFTQGDLEQKALVDADRARKELLARGDTPALGEIPEPEDSVTPTEESPIRTIGAPEAEEDVFDTLSDEDKFVEIGLKRAKGEELSDDELRFLIRDQRKSAEVDVSPITSAVDEQRKGLTAELRAEEARQKQERDRLFKEEEARVGARTQREEGEIARAGEKEGEAVQTALSFSGFGRSTFNAERQADIQRDVGERQQLVRDAATKELELFRRQLEGDDAASLQPLKDEITLLRNTATQAEVDAAIKTAEMNAANQTSGLDAIANIMEVLGESTANKIDIGLTDSINDGFLYGIDANGLPYKVTDASGNAIQSGVNDEANSGLSFTAPKADIFGNLTSPGYIFDKGTGDLTMIDPVTGEQLLLGSGAEAENASNVYKNFDAYISGTGRGKTIGGSKYHTSEFQTDIPGNEGSPVNAYATGEVVEARTGWNGGWGNTVVVDSNGTLVRYAHLKDLNVKEGDRIIAGDLVGGLGNTGISTGPHLHIEAKDKNGNLVSLDSLNANETQWRNTGADPNTTPFGLEGMNLVLSGSLKPELLKWYVSQREKGVAQDDIINKNLDTKQKIDLEIKLGGNFEQYAKESRASVKNISIIEAGYEAAIQAGFDGTSLNPASQAMLVTFQKMLDPTSVVRESEYARSGDGQSLSQRIQGFGVKLSQGGAGVTQAGLQEFYEMSLQLLDGYKAQMVDFARRTQTQADSYGLDLENILTPDVIDILNEGTAPEPEGLGQDALDFWESLPN